ncbi:HNH endonuclease [Bacillus niameyensis]|uniref:HNH endonuclease n=1 Tax=Bacillus niameyensis TaxID=1522308 RepID=UPI0007811189|nr:HNH endonuclease [Bacillus niameyensis]
MGIFRMVGKGIGTAGGTLIGGSVKIAGKAVGSQWKGAGDWIEQVGDGVRTASKVSFDNAGQFVDGALQGTYGLLKKDAHSKQKGLEDIKDSVERTVKGIGSTVSYTVNNAGRTCQGIAQGDKAKMTEGLKNVGKVVAVSSIAIGILDLLDGADGVSAEEIDTRNAELNGLTHPDTGVEFIEKTVTLPDSSLVEGTFPVFDSGFEVTLPQDDYIATDSVHFTYANHALFDQIQETPRLAGELGLTEGEVQALQTGQTPEGYTWHHHEEPGNLQLVDEETHAKTGHTGGRSLWAGGTESR